MLSKTLRTILEASADNARADGPSIDLLREVWPTLLGEPMCHRTRPSAYVDGKLVIGVASEAWLAEARRNRRRLHARIVRRLPWPVDELEFVVESLPAAPQNTAPAPPAPTAPADAPDDATVRDDLDRLDETTRELMLRIRGHIDREQ